jgi:hypothetical protein
MEVIGWRESFGIEFTIWGKSKNCQSELGIRNSSNIHKSTKPLDLRPFLILSDRQKRFTGTYLGKYLTWCRGPIHRPGSLG